MRPTQPASDFPSPRALRRARHCSTENERLRRVNGRAISVLCALLLTAAAQAQADEPGAQSPTPATTSSAPATTSSAPSPDVAASAVQPTTSASSTVTSDQLSDLDRRTRDIRDQVFRSKARLSLLTETLLGSAQGGAKLVVVQKDQMGRLYQMVKVSYQLDGREVYVRSLEPGRPTDSKEQNVYDGNVRPGDHTLAIAVTYRGDGNKVFSYYDQYQFTAKAAHRFSVVDGQTTRLEVRCFEKGNPMLVRVEDRPAFDFRVESTKKAN